MEYVLRTDEENSVARFTVSLGDDHSFEAYTRQYDDETRVIISYEETATWRGGIEVLDGGPSEDVWEILTTSDEFLEYLERVDADTIRREGADT